MTRTRQLSISALMTYTLGVTALRTVRLPNDFAEAHWLLDYRFGFVKRGLVGEIVTLVTTYLAMPVTAEVISALALAAFAIFCGALLVLSIRILRRSGWSADAALANLTFLCSPFIVMSAHLIGYHDNIVIVLGILSVLLLLERRPWLAALMQIAALLTSEISLVLVFPALCLAWLMVNRRRDLSRETRLPVAALILPMVAFLALIVNQERLVRSGFPDLFAAHLSQFPFIQEGRSTWVPFWLTASFLDYFATQSGEFLARISSIAMYALILPTVVPLLVYTLRAYRIRTKSTDTVLILGVSLAPQLLHLVAWDTARIWTYTILCAFLVLWLHAEVADTHRAGLAIRWVCFGALLANAVILTPLMDLETDHFGLGMRLLLYMPVFIGGLMYAHDGQRLSAVKALGGRASGKAAVKPPPGVGDESEEPATGAPPMVLGH